MVTEKLDYINQDEIRVDNYDTFYPNSKKAIDSLDTIDIKNYEKNIQKLSHVYDTQMRFISDIEPSDPKYGMAWFIFE